MLDRVLHRLLHVKCCATSVLEAPEDWDAVDILQMVGTRGGSLAVRAVVRYGGEACEYEGSLKDCHCASGVP